MRRLLIVFAALLAGLSSSGQRLIPFIPDSDKANGAAVIVCPGGSYYWLGRRVEGIEVAEKLCSEGFAAFVLYYRHAGMRYFLFRGLAFPQNHYPDALDDLSKAIADVRAGASGQAIDPAKIGVLGFSAGGHLALDAGKELSGPLKPSFIASVYPVVTMVDEAIVHDRSRRALLGSRYKDRALRRKLSMELDIPADMPPVFLVSCKDDSVVDPGNAGLMDAALAAAGIPHEYHEYETGGHGFGAGSEAADWFPFFVNWCKKCIFAE